MIVKQTKCPSCGGPQDSKLVKLGEWNCEWCGDHLCYKNDVVEVLPTTTQSNNIDTKDTKPTTLENPAFTAISVIYLFSFFVAIVALLFFVNIDTAIWGFTLASNIYIAIAGFGIGISPIPEKESTVSDQTAIAVLLWFIYNILLMILGFPVAILTRLGASFIYFIVGAIIGTILSRGAVTVEIKKVDEFGPTEE